MGQIPNHFISWHYIWAFCRPCGFHSNKISSQYKKPVEDHRGKKEIWMEQKAGAKVRISWGNGNFLLLCYLFQKTSINPLDASRCKSCSCSHNLSRFEIILLQAIVSEMPTFPIEGVCVYKWLSEHLPGFSPGPLCDHGSHSPSSQADGQLSWQFGSLASSVAGVLLEGWAVVSFT